MSLFNNILIHINLYLNIILRKKKVLLLYYFIELMTALSTVWNHFYMRILPVIQLLLFPVNANITSEVWGFIKFKDYII